MSSRTVDNDPNWRALYDTALAADAAFDAALVRTYGSKMAGGMRYRPLESMELVALGCAKVTADENLRRYIAVARLATDVATLAQVQA